MSLGTYLRSLFSPYELSAAGILASYAFLAATVVAIATTHRLAAVLPLVALSGAATMAGRYFGRCPNCGKPPTKLFLTADERSWGGMLYLHRWWPERECSSCRTPLDVI